MALVLHDYWRSSASYRVRIALALKGLEYERRPVDLVKGAHREEAYRALNPQGFVPMLEANGLRLNQSIAIIAWLEQTHPEPRLLPADAGEGAHVRAMALTIACDIHPLNNLRVLKYLVGPLGQSDEAKEAWVARWIGDGFAALEALAAPRAGRFLFGDAPTLADVCLVPQMYNARRFGVAVEDYPTLVRADAEAQGMEPFRAAHPDRFAPTS